MDNTEAQDRAKDFENKEKSEILAMPMPEGLSNDALDAWWLARAQTIDALDEAAESRPALPADLSFGLVEGHAADLLEKQIASSAALFDHLTRYIARDNTDPHICMSFMDRMTAMLGATANVGKVVGRLRGVASEFHQTFAYESRGRQGRG